MSRYSVLLDGTLPLHRPAVPSDAVAPVLPMSEPSKELPKAEIVDTEDKTVSTGREIIIQQNDNMTARQHDGTLSSHHDSMTAKRPYALHDFLNEKATEKTTIRIPKALVDYLEDTLYRIKREHQIKLSMQAIQIVALASFCLEFEQQGSEGSLYKQLIQEMGDSKTA